MELVTLNEYTQIANKFLKNYYRIKGRKPRGIDEEFLIGDLVFTLIKSDMSYKEDHFKGLSLQRWRGFNCIRLIKRTNERAANYYKFKSEYVKNMKGKLKGCYYDQIDLDEKDPINKDILFLLHDSGLTEIQRHHIELYLQGKTIKEMAAETNKTVQNVKITIKNALCKMKKVAE